MCVYKDIYICMYIYRYLYRWCGGNRVYKNSGGGLFLLLLLLLIIKWERRKRMVLSPFFFFHVISSFLCALCVLSSLNSCDFFFHLKLPYLCYHSKQPPSPSYTVLFLSPPRSCNCHSWTDQLVKLLPVSPFLAVLAATRNRCCHWHHQTVFMVLMQC